VTTAIFPFKSAMSYLPPKRMAHSVNNKTPPPLPIGRPSPLKGEGDIETQINTPLRALPFVLYVHSFSISSLCALRYALCVFLLVVAFSVPVGSTI